MKETISQFIENMVAGMYDQFPKILVALVILLLGYLTALIIKRLTIRFLLYLNRGMNLRLQNKMLNVDLKNSATFIAATFFWVIILVTLLLCIHMLEISFLKDFFDQVIRFVPNIIVAIIIVFVGIISGRLLADLLNSAARRSGVRNRGFLGIIVRYFTLIVAILIAADQLGIQVGFLSAIINIILAALLLSAALAFGLGAKTSVGNILGAYYARRDYKVGNRIRFDDAVGTIVKISDHSVHLETHEGRIIIPAKQFNELKITIIREGHE